MPEKTVLITGANRGIGLEFVTQYAARGWRVIAGCRSPDQAEALHNVAVTNPTVTVEPLDVTDYGRISALAAKHDGTAIGVLLNNAGLYGHLKRQSWGTLDPDLFHQLLTVNVLGPMKMIEAFAPHVAASGEKKIVAITSFLGSKLRQHTALDPVLRAQQSGPHMAMRGASEHFKDRGIAVVVFMPGLVKTRMLRQTFGLSQSEAEAEDGFDYRDLNPIDATISVSGMIPLIDALTWTPPSASSTMTAKKSLGRNLHKRKGQPCFA